MTSKRGYASIKTTNNAWFTGKEPYEGCPVFNHPRESAAIHKPSPRDPVSPKNIFLDDE